MLENEDVNQYEVSMSTVRGREGSPVVDSSGTETTLNDLESFTPTENQVLLGNSNVVVDHLVVTFRSIVVSELIVESTRSGSRTSEREKDD